MGNYDTSIKIGTDWKIANGIWQKVNGKWVRHGVVYNKVNGLWKIVFFDSVPPEVVMLMQDDIPSTESGWIQDTSNADGKYVRIASSYGGVGGSSTHTHTLSSAYYTASKSNHAGNDQKNPVHAHMTRSYHRHTIAHTHTSSNTKSNVTYVPYKDGTYIPRNAVLLWTDSTSPIGLGVEQHTSLKYYSLRLGDSYGVNSYTHTDSYSGYSGYVDCSLVNTSRDYGSSSADYGQHRHSISHTHQTLSAVYTQPLGSGFRMFKTTQDFHYVPSGVCFLYKGTEIPQGYTDITPTVANMYMSLYSGEGDRYHSYGNVYHSLPYTSFTTSTIRNYTRTHGLQENDRYVVPNHTHGFAHAHSGSSYGLNNPPYRNYMLIRKD